MNISKPEKAAFLILAGTLFAGSLFLHYRQAGRGHAISVHRNALSAELTLQQIESRLIEERKIDINSASAEELTNIPGIGKAYAERIISYRNCSGPFGVGEDLLDVKGIGPARLEKLKEYVRE